MKILLLNQTFWPDVASTAQHLQGLAVALAERGHQVTVVTSRRAYDDPNRCFAPRETWRGVEIHRIWCTGFGKSAKWRRALDFASFMIFCCGRLLSLPRHDVLVALTSPPLISFVGALVSKLRRSRFLYWVMDLNPDEAIAAGWLQAGSLVARLLDRMSRFSLRQAEKVIVLDRFMRERVMAKGIEPEKIEVLPPWSQDDAVRFDPKGRERFRKAHGLEDKFVVMYSGNHSPCHPLDTLLEAARRLESRVQSPTRCDAPSKFPSETGIAAPRESKIQDSRSQQHTDKECEREGQEIVFCLVGGGSEWRRIRDEAQPSSILCLPYQSLAELAGSLSAADLHVVVMGEEFVGTIHPCKIYNILAVAAPVLYIGPRPSHASEILDQMAGHPLCACAAHGDVERVIQHIQRVRSMGGTRDFEAFGRLASQFSKEALLPELVRVIEHA